MNAAIMTTTKVTIDADIIDTLIDSGGYMIGYWAESAVEQDDGTWLYTVQDEIDTEYDGQTYRLDDKAILLKLQVLEAQYKRIFNDIVIGDIDAAIGDCFVQACIFGDIIFG